jgi:hypothetical protein
MLNGRVLKRNKRTPTTCVLFACSGTYIMVQLTADTTVHASYYS